MIPILTLLASLALPPLGDLPSDTLSAAALLRPTLASATLAAPLALPPGGVNHLAPVPLVGLAAASAPRNPPQLVEYSDAYFTRLTIHRWASFLTVPLFAGQYIVGQKLYDGDGSDNLRGIHGVLAGSVAGLFAVNTITGGWNAIEGWKDPEGRTRRTIHTVLMLIADAGFVATGALAQESDEGGESGGNRTHRNVALASMGTALVSYAIMLPIFGRSW